MTSLSVVKSMAGMLLLLSYAPIASGFRAKPRKRSSQYKRQHREKEAVANAESSDDDYSGPIDPLPDKCSMEEWKDSQKFDCQLYEGARWCEKGADYQLGPGWCFKGKKCDKTAINKGGFALTGDQRWGWGTFKHQLGKGFPMTAQQACRGCGSTCPPTPPKRALNSIAKGCIDFSAPNGQSWRGRAGYTCGAYHHGGFCRWINNKWAPGKLMEGYGTLDSYKHWAMNGTKRVKMSPLRACCSCGGGSTCTNGWKVRPKCEREFSYKGKLFSGCTTEANDEVSGGVAWCSHNKDYKKGEWTRCNAC